MAAPDAAIVLRLTEYSETSQIATLFARGAGQVRLIAKGMRRNTRTRINPGLDLLEFGEVAWISARGDAQLGTLTEWVQRDAFTGLRHDLARLYAGMYAGEAVSRLTQELDPHPEIFDGLLRLLRALSAEQPSGEDAAGRESPASLLAEFQSSLLVSIGLAPNLAACVRCGRTRPAGRPAWFSASAGGLVCRSCSERMAGRVQLPASLLDQPLDARTGQAWFAFHDAYITHVLSRPLQMSGVMRDCLRCAK